MANETSKCPMCGTKLKMMNGRMTCKKCGYYLRGESENVDYQTGGSYNTASDSGSSRNRSAGQYSSGGQYSAGSGSAGSRQGATGAAGSSGQSSWQSSSRSSSPGQHAEHNPKVAIIVSVVAGALCVALFAVIVLVKSGAFRQMLPDSDSRESSVASHRESTESEDTEDSERPVRGNASSYAQTPSSSFFWSVAEYIWDKPCDTITEEEFASLKAIQINREEKTISYQMDGGEVETASYETDAGLELSDLSCFTGLERISIDDSFMAGDLRSLENLTALYSENNLDDMQKIIPNPENITELGIEDTFLAKTLSGLESFPKLQYLDVDYAGLEDISALSQFPDLLGLTLTGCDRLTDFSPLMSLTKLEQLYIESDQLKSIDFIRNMPNLYDFSVESSQITSVDALAECPEMVYLYLYLDDSYGVEDYSVISGLTHLTEMVLEMDWGRNGTLPSLANMPDLQYLSVKNARDLTPLSEATGLTYLALENCDGNSLEAITSLENLTALYINDFSVYTSTLEPLTRLPNLTVLSMEETSVFGNVEEVFGIPTLTYLYLEDCQIGLDFDKLPDNETLTVLSLDDTTILIDPTYNNGDKIYLSDHYDMFDHFPNLTELYLESQGIDSIDFVEKLPLLQYLDITDNNVTSLKPLESLSDFQAVWCGQNTILENPSEASGITVYTTEP